MIEIRISAQNEAELRGYAALIGQMAVPAMYVELQSQAVVDSAYEADDKARTAAQAERDAKFEERLADVAKRNEEPAKRTRRTKAEMEAAKASDEAVDRAPVGPDEAAKLVHAHTETTAPVEGEVLPKVTMEFLRDEMQRISTDQSVDATRALLKKFGIPRLSALETERYAEFAAAAASWTVESV
jgi:hypothetical protein